MNLTSIIKESISSVNDDDILRNDVDGKFVYEIVNVPTSRQIRGQLNETLKLKLEESFPDISISLVGSVKIGESTYRSKAKVLRINDGPQRGANVLGVIKLNPKPKLVLTPKKFGVTKSTGPASPSSYLTVEDVISTIKTKLNELLEQEKISNSLYNWVNQNLDYFNPNITSNNARRIKTSWGGQGLRDEISSELLELFCAIAYIKYIQKGNIGQGIRINNAERNRVKEILGTTSIPNSPDAFKIWYPSASNFPIIDCQVAYFEGNVIKAVFPISTKNISFNTLPNTIKFVDIFKDTNQVNIWKDHLPKTILKEQLFQYRVSHSAIKDRSTLYPSTAAETLLTSSQRNAFFAEVKRYISSSEIRIDINTLTRISKKITSNSKDSKKSLDKISITGDDLVSSKKLICVLLKKSPIYKDIFKTFTIDQLSIMNETQWNSRVKVTYKRCNYPFTVANVSLFFEKVLENSSVFKNGKYDYDEVVKRAYFTNNSVLKSKYGGVSISGSGEIILAKVNIQNDGMIRIQMDTSSSVSNRKGYGLRSKNALGSVYKQGLQDSLGITP